MPFTSEYTNEAPAPSEVASLAGATVLEFGNSWCGHCRRAEALVAEAFSSHPTVRHVKIADGTGRRLGRLFAVKLWPTLVFLRDGREVARLTRPTDADQIQLWMRLIDPD